MTQWPEMTLGEICAEGGGWIRTGPFGSQLHQSDYVDDPSGIPVLMPKDMAGGRIDLSTIARIDDETASRLSQHLLAEGDVALSRRGDVGRSVWIASEDLPVFCGTGSMRVHPGTPSSVRPDYLRYFFRSRLAIDYLEGQAVGATMPNLNAGIVTGMPVPILPLLLQEFAAHTLSTLDDLIESNRRQVEVLEQIVQATYREWFLHFRYPGHETAPFVDSPLGPTPDGWELLPASDALLVNPRVTLDKSVEHPFITMSDLQERSMVCFPSDMKLGNSGAKFKNGDTLFARITPCLENGKTGFVQCLDHEQVGRGSTEFIVLRGRVVGPSFTYCLARSEQFRRHAIQSMSGASGRQRVRNECFDSYNLAVPPHDVAESFEEVAIPVFETIYSLTLQASRLAVVHDLLLPKLVTGQIDLSSLAVDVLVQEAVA